MFYKSPSVLRLLYPDLIWEQNGPSNQVYLTFDDGPHPEITRKVLDLLEQHQFTATFFCIGDNVVRYPEVYSEILERGHRVGNHTQHHVKGWNCPTDIYRNEVNQCAEVVDSDLFRPPYGRITRAQIKDLRDDYRLVLWSLLSWDFKTDLRPGRSLSRLKKYTRPGSIVVFHDSEKAADNLFAILPEYLSFLSTQGLRSAAL